MARPGSAATAAARVLAKRYWREDDGRIVVAAVAASGLSASEYASRYGIDSRRILRWQGRLASGVTSESSVGLSFLPVRVRGGASAPPTILSESLPPCDNGPLAIEVVVGRYTVRLAAGFDTAGLHQVLGVLEARPC